jgi:hypothetical protein
VTNKNDASLVGLNNSSDQIKQRRLAGTIGSNESDNFTFPDPEADIVYRE